MKQKIEQKIELLKQALSILTEEKLIAFIKGELVAYESVKREIEKNERKIKN